MRTAPSLAESLSANCAVLPLRERENGNLPQFGL
jgi:hypothetical protein